MSKHISTAVLASLAVTALAACNRSSASPFAERDTGSLTSGPAQSAYSGASAGPILQASQDGTGAALAATSSASATAIYAEAAASDARVVRANSTATGGGAIAVWASSQSSSGTGVLGDDSAPSGFTYGVRGKVMSTNGTGVWGNALAGSGSTVGVRGDSASPNGYGFFARATSTSGANYGLYAESASTNGIGTLALNTALSGPSVGLRAEARSQDGIAALIDNTAGGLILSGQTAGTPRFQIDGSGNAWAAGALSATAAGFSGGVSASSLALNLPSGAVFSWQPDAGSSRLGLAYGNGAAPSSTGLSINPDGTINFAANQTFPLSPASASFSHRGDDGSEIAFVSDQADSVHSFTAQSGSQMHFRLSRSTPDTWGAKDFLITPYNYGMAMEYPGVLEFWVHDFSVHNNNNGLAPEDQGPANFWVGDELDKGGLFATAHYGDGTTQDAVLAADRFDHTSHGSMVFRVRNPSDAFTFQVGPYQGETTKASIAGAAGRTALDLYFDVVHAFVQATPDAIRIGSDGARRVDLVSGDQPRLSVSPAGNVSIGNVAGASLLSVGSAGAFAVDGQGAVTIGAGTAIRSHLSTVVALSQPALSDGTCSSVPVAVPGARDGDTVALGVAASLASTEGLTFFGYAVSDDVVMIRVCNTSRAPLGASAPGTVRVDVWKH